MVYGLVHPINTFDSNAIQVIILVCSRGKSVLFPVVIMLQMNHYVAFIKNFWYTPGIMNKLKFLFCGPGWRPGTKRLGNPEDIPKVKLRFFHL